MRKVRKIQSQMQVKQQFDLIVFPKTFTILNFYSKGLYRLEISLTAQEQSTNNLVRGFPSVIQGRDALKNEQKKAKVIIKDDKLVYSSQNFYVTFSAQNFHFHAMPIFKLQLDRQKRYKVYIDFNLILTQYRISKNHQGSSKENKNNEGYLPLGPIDQKVVVVDSKRLYLNNLRETNTFQRLVFSEPDYFSYSDAYIFSMRTGSHLRAYSIGLYEFHLLSIEQRSRLDCLKPQQVISLVNELQEGCNKEIRKLFPEGVVSFYKQMIEKPISEYKNLAYAYQHLRAMMFTLNNSTIIQNISIQFLDYIGKSIFPDDYQGILSESQLKLLIQDYYQTQNQAELYVEIIHETQLITANKTWLFSQFCQLLIKINYNVFQLLAQPVVREKIETKQKQFICHGDIQKEKNINHQNFISFRQKYCKTQTIVEDFDLKHPFIMLEGYGEEEKSQTSKKQKLKPYVIDNLVVFVHGYQGSDFDLQMAKFNLQMFNTHSYCLMSTSIQDQMDESIEYLGLQLATEITEHIKHTYNIYKRINFVGYSLGGIIIRQAIKHLEEYKEKMNIFLSLASPHTGTIDGGNILIKTGIWYLINFQNAKNIKQLHCQFDGKEEENFVLKKLSECDTLQWFRKFIVASSQQDSFVPYTSSRIDGIEGSSVTKIMCENIRKRIKKLQRVQVWFDVNQHTGTLDKILGRRAHIEFLQNKVFLSCLFRLYAHQF